RLVGAFGINRQTRTDTITPGTMFTRKSQCQEKCSVTQPPSVGPIDGARVATMPSATCCSMERVGPKREEAAASVVGTLAAWRQRKTMRLCRSHASAHMALAAVKPTQE